MKSIHVVLIAFLILQCSCSKDNGSGNNNTPPSNLVVNATVNPDNSGNVTFTASAANAVTYSYAFGNGIFQTVPSGNITYKYPSPGTYAVIITAKSAGGQIVSKTISVTVTIALAVFWSDEFNTDGAPDPAKWGYDVGTGAGGWGNNELQYYTDRTQNVVVQGGVLKINAIKESFSGNDYTSARIISKDKFAFKYGKVEVRAKLPSGVGTWPAAWMLGANIGTVGWPNCGEIDIMEHRGSDLNKIHGTLHYPGRSGGNADGSTKVIANATTEFHIYKLEWTASSIKIFVDDVEFHSVTNSAGLPFNQDFFLLLNVAMGGTFGGAVDPAFTNATMEVDYIRVYK